MKIDKIALIGKSGAGKTEVANHLNKRYGFLICNTGERVRGLAYEFFGTQAKHILHKIDDAFNTIERGIWLRLALRGITLENSNVVIDSLRFAEDYTLAKQMGFRIWRITCDSKTRLSRLALRGQEYTEENEYHVSENELDSCVTDLNINNETDINVLYSIIDNAISNT